MDASLLFPPSEYLKADDVDENGGEMVLTISNVGRKEYDGENGKKDVKGLISFQDSEKKLVSNSTNTNSLIAMFGKETNGWIGKQIHLYVDENIQFGNEIKRGIRIRRVDERQDKITEYWKVNTELGYTRAQGLAHLDKFNKDFSAALAAMKAESDGRQ